MNILKSKKGIALENAILFMMVIFSLCFLIASFTLIGHHQGEIEGIKLEQRVELDQIGEDFLKDPAGFTDDPDDQYSCSVTTEDTDNVLTVTIGGNVVLYVRLNSTGNPIVWRYSEL
ncbi:MAG: hypothetical protein IKJ07_07735 [Clostridia bacterium]|nr:hypothetical protein [Clostridia bacterium]